MIFTFISLSGSINILSCNRSLSLCITEYIISLPRFQSIISLGNIFNLLPVISKRLYLCSLSIDTVTSASFAIRGLVKSELTRCTFLVLVFKTTLDESVIFPLSLKVSI